MICTYHGFCVKVLRENIYRLGYPRNFIIVDKEDPKAILKEVFEELNIKSDKSQHIKSFDCHKWLEKPTQARL